MSSATFLVTSSRTGARIVGRSCVVTETELTRLQAFLTEEEQARVARFVTADLRRRAAVARGFVREVLGEILARDPASLTFGTGPKGKPHLLDHGIYFNISHSEEQVVVATSTLGEVGVDIEEIRASVGHEEIAAGHFGVGERAYLGALAADRKLTEFFRIWTGKEAIAKCTGEGISFALSKIDLCDPLSVQHWTLEHWLRPDGFSLSLASGVRLP